MGELLTEAMMYRFELANRRRRARWAVAGVLMVGLVGGCGEGGIAGSGSGDPRDALSDSSRKAQQAGSARYIGTTDPGWGQPVSFQGTLSWKNGLTGEMTMTGSGLPGGGPVRITEDALYSIIPTGLPGQTAGKRWGKLSYADLALTLGPVGKAFAAVLTQTNPVRSAAMLRQAGDLKLVGQEQRNGIVTRHFAGTIEPVKLVEDLKLGLTDEVIAELRAEYQKAGMSSEQLDVWLDDQNLPVHVEAKATDATGRQVVYAADYSDYGQPGQISAPPADEVYDLGEYLKSPLPTSPPR
jgi:hypothetical protein